MQKLQCFKCRKEPREIEEYVSAAADDDYDNTDAYVYENEGTLNMQTGTFACTDCYVAIGMPSSPAGWVAPALIEHEE